MPILERFERPLTASEVRIMKQVIGRLQERDKAGTPRGIIVFTFFFAVLWAMCLIARALDGKGLSWY